MIGIFAYWFVSGYLLGRLAHILVFMVGWGLVPFLTATAEQNSADATLSAQVDRFYSESKFDEAIPFAKRLLAIRERGLGPDHPDVAASLNSLANLYYQLSRYAEAEPLYKRALVIREKTSGPNQLDLASLLNDMGQLHYWQERYGDAEPLYKRALAIRESVLGHDHPDVVMTVNNLGLLYYWQKRYPEAEPLLRRVLGFRQKSFGPDHIDVAASMSNLADLYYYMPGRLAAAEPLYRRALAIRETALGSEHLVTAKSLQDLADTLGSEGRHVEAAPLMTRALAIREKILGIDHETVAYSLNQLAWSVEEQGHYKDGETLLRRALAIREKRSGGSDKTIAFSLGRLADNLVKQSRFQEAQPQYERAISILEKAVGRDHSDVAKIIESMAILYAWQNRFAKAEKLMRRALAIREKTQGLDHPDFARSLRTLAQILQWQSRNAEAEPLYKRSLAISESALGPDHPSVAESLYHLAGFVGIQDLATMRALYSRALTIFEKTLGPNNVWAGACLAGLSYAFYSESRYAEAEPLAVRALKIYEMAYGANHPFVATRFNSLANIYYWQNRYDEAETLYRKTQAIYEKSLGPDHYHVAESLTYLGDIEYSRRRYADAKVSYERALQIYEKSFGPDHTYVGDALYHIAYLYAGQENWPVAASYFQRATDLIIRRTHVRIETAERSRLSSVKGERETASDRFKNLIKATHHLPAWEKSGDLRFATAMFRAAQWAQNSEAAAALLQMSIRSAKGDTALAHLVRERQDLVAVWQAYDKRIIAAQSDAPDRRDPVADQGLGAKQTAVDRRIAEIDATLAKEFPDFAALTGPEPLSIEEVQALLRRDEVLILFLDTVSLSSLPEETFIWVVTKNDSRWVRSDFGTRSLNREIAALRCGLDYYGSWGSPGSRCPELLKINYSEADFDIGKPLPFDIKRAHEVYKALFGQVGDLIKDKHLLLVPSGPLTQLPFQALVTEMSDPGLIGTEALRHAAWLARSHAATVLPSVSSLKSLRQLAKGSDASRALIGFGNPLLVGPSKDYQDAASAARAKQSCPNTMVWGQVATLVGERRGVLPLTLRGGIADVIQIRSQVPLPETADELCAVARDLKVSGDEIRLGAHATETEVKRLSQSSELANYRMVHFATHGALAGQVGGGSEPGLVLTPPETATEFDDGYLSASEVAGLKLDADWVILSACNTAAGGAEGAEALSGLARAFFYAGARALLVSHWSVYSDAAVKLITGATNRMAADTALGRAEATRQSMLALIDKGTPAEAHPAFWAPFIVVGEGAARSQ